MYESTVDVLYFLYGKLSIGGYVIMDDVSNHRSTWYNVCNDIDILTSYCRTLTQSGLVFRPRQLVKIFSRLV